MVAAAHTTSGTDYMGTSCVGVHVQYKCERSVAVGF